MPRPSDPLELLAWVNQQREELDLIQRQALFDARLQGNFEEAIRISGLSRKRAVAATRHENEARGRMVRWGDQ